MKKLLILIMGLLMSSPIYAQELRHVKGLEFVEAAIGKRHLALSYGKYLQREIYVKLGARYESVPLIGLTDSLINVIEGDSLFDQVQSNTMYRSYTLHGSFSYNMFTVSEQLFVNTQLGVRLGLEHQQAEQRREYFIWGFWFGPEMEWYPHARFALSTAARQHIVFNSLVTSRRMVQLGIKIII